MSWLRICCCSDVRWIWGCLAETNTHRCKIIIVSRLNLPTSCWLKDGGSCQNTLDLPDKQNEDIFKALNRGRKSLRTNALDQKDALGLYMQKLRVNYKWGCSNTDTSIKKATDTTLNDDSGTCKDTSLCTDLIPDYLFIRSRTCNFPTVSCTLVLNITFTAQSTTCAV